MIIYTSNKNKPGNSNRINQVVIANGKICTEISEISSDKHQKLVFLRGVNLSNNLKQISDLDCDYLFIDTCEGLEGTEEQLVSACQKVKKIIFYGRKGNFKLNNTKVFFFSVEIELVKSREFEQIATKHNAFCEILERFILSYQTTVTPLTTEQLQDKSFKPMEVMSGRVLLMFDHRSISDLNKVVTRSPSVVYVVLPKIGNLLSENHITILKEMFPNLKSITVRGIVSPKTSTFAISKEISIVHESYGNFDDQVLPPELLNRLNSEDKKMVEKAYKRCLMIKGFNRRRCIESVIDNAYEISVSNPNADKTKEYKALRLLSELPVGWWPTLLQDSHSSKRLIDGMTRLIENVNPIMDEVLTTSIVSYFVNSLLVGSFSGQSPFVFIGQPGTGKTYNAQIFGYCLAYLHYFIYYTHEYSQITEEDVLSAQEFAKKYYEQFCVFIDVSKVSGVIEINGGSKTYVSSNPGVLRHIAGNFIDENGVEYPFYFRHLVFDEFEKGSRGGVNGEPPMLYAIMIHDTQSFDNYLRMSYKLGEFCSICYLGNTVPENAKPFMSRLSRFEVSGFTIEEKMFNAYVLIRNIAESMDRILQSGVLGGLEFYEDKEHNACIRDPITRKPIIIFERQAIRRLALMTNDTSGMREFKQYTKECFERAILAYLPHEECQYIRENNLHNYLHHVKPVRFFDPRVGESIYAASSIGNYECGLLVISTELSSGGQQTIHVIPGGKRESRTDFQITGRNTDPCSVVFGSLLETIKGTINYPNPPINLHGLRSFNSAIQKQGQKNIVIKLSSFYDEDLSESSSIIGTTALIAYMSFILQRQLNKFVILGYCNTNGNFEELQNAESVIKLSLNNIVDLDTKDVVTVFVPSSVSGDLYEVYKISNIMKQRIRFVKANNIFDIIKDLFPEFNEKK
jgi:hypothetical protein